MSRQKRRGADIFSLSFLDIIACGFGAIVLLLLIVKPNDPNTNALVNNTSINNLFTLQDKKKLLDEEVAELTLIINNLEESLTLKIDQEIDILEEIKSVEKQKSIVASIQEQLNIAQQTLTDEMNRIIEGNDRDDEVGGIPVDSEYIIFVIDNSGSMESPWRYVINEMKNIMDIHPTIKGIQVMNDQGYYLMKSRAGKGQWIPDTLSTRNGILELLQNRSSWRDRSMSNPVKGITTAIKNHYIEGRKISIYLLGDDLMSSSVDLTINQIDKINTDQFSGKRKARIHGIVFAGQAHANLITYPNFIRQLTLRNEGTALFIPIDNHGGWKDCSAGNCGWVSD
jgi:hypothetical protein